MQILTRAAVDAINNYFRYGDQCDEAYFDGRSADEAAFHRLSTEARAQVTEEQLAAYLDAGIEPPHVVGDERHRAQVDTYFAGHGSDPL